MQNKIQYKRAHSPYLWLTYNGVKEWGPNCETKPRGVSSDLHQCFTVSSDVTGYTRHFGPNIQTKYKVKREECREWQDDNLIMNPQLSSKWRGLYVVEVPGFIWVCAREEGVVMSDDDMALFRALRVGDNIPFRCDHWVQISRRIRRYFARTTPLPTTLVHSMGDYLCERVTM